MLPHLFASGQQGRALGHGTVDLRLDPFSRALRDHRSDIGVRQRVVAHVQRPCQFHNPVDNRAVNGLVDKDALTAQQI